MLFVDKCRMNILPSSPSFPLTSTGILVDFIEVEQGTIPGARLLCSRAHAQVRNTIITRYVSVSSLDTCIVFRRNDRKRKKCEGRREADGRWEKYLLRGPGESFTHVL